MSLSADLPFDELHRHAAFLRALARGIVKDEQLSEDVVQQVFVRALLAPPAERGALRTWLARATQRLALNTARERTRREQREQACARAESVNDAAGLELVVQRRILEAVDALDEPYRSTIYLRYYRGVTPTQIARELGLSLKTVEARITRAHRILRERLDRTLRGERGVMAALVLPNVTSRAAEAGTLLGGLLMSKNALLILAAVVAAGGVWIARRGLSPDEPADADTSRSADLGNAAAPSDRAADVEVANDAAPREAIAASSPDETVAEPITATDDLVEAIERVLASIEGSFTGTFDPGAVLDGALLLAMHDFGPAVPEPDPGGRLFFPMLDAPDGVEAELQVARNSSFQTVLSLEMRFEVPREPWLMEGRPHEEPKAAVTVWTNDAGELLDFTVSTGAQPAKGFPYESASEVPYGVLLHTDMSDPSGWKLSMGGLRPAATDEATGNRSWTSADWEVPQVLGGPWPRTDEMQELARRLDQRYAEIRARHAR